MSHDHEYQPDHEENPLELGVYPPAEEVPLPALLGALGLQPPELVSAAQFHVDHEETVETSEDLQTPQVGVELPTLTVEVDVGPADIADLNLSLLIHSDDEAVVLNTHNASGSTLLAVLDEVVTAGTVENSNALSSSSESLYEDANDQVWVPLPAPALERRGEPEVGASIALAEETTPLLAPEEEETEQVPVLEAEEPEVFVEASAHNDDHEDEEDPAFQDPLDVSPVLQNLGFERVQTAYDQWLQNMSHAVSLFQGKSEYFYQLS